MTTETLISLFVLLLGSAAFGFLNAWILKRLGGGITEGIFYIAGFCIINSSVLLLGGYNLISAVVNTLAVVIFLVLFRLTWFAQPISDEKKKKNDECEPKTFEDLLSS